MYQHDYDLRCGPLQLMDKYSRWRKRAKLIKLTDKTMLRLEWIIFYHTIACKNASMTCRHYGISRDKLYYWLNRFDELNLKTLEDLPFDPKTKRSWQPDPLELQQMIALWKQYIHWGKMKLSVRYHKLYGKPIASWQFQRVIEEFKLYPAKPNKKCQGNGAKRERISKAIRQACKNLC